MKKTLAFLISVMMVCSLSACGDSSSTADTGSSDTEQSSAVDSTEPSESPADEPTDSTEPSESSADEPMDSTEPSESSADESSDTSGEAQTGDSVTMNLLNTVWGSYGDDEKFPAAGGDMSEEHMSMDGPGIYGLADADALDATLGFPAASVDKIDDAASLMHMMNANTFTCGAYHVINADDIADLEAAIKDNIMTRQWMCGFPDQLVIATVDDCVVAFFGENEIVDTFQDKLTAAYSGAVIAVEEPIV